MASGFARAQTILTLAQSTGPKVEHLAIVGHNPGISELARSLAPEGATLGELSTACACSLTFSAGSWAELAPPAARMARYEPPAGPLEFFS